MIEETQGIKLGGTDTGKTFAALIDDIRKQGLGDKGILFWHTYNSKDSSDTIATADYHQLPKGF